jgi:outer membrane lipoprotein-sorting protein
VARPRPSRSSRSPTVVAVALVAAFVLHGCASTPVRRQIAPEAEIALARLEQQRASITDLRSRVDLRIRRDDKTQRLSGVLLLRAPASLRFEALTTFGVPVVLVAGDAQSVTLWEVIDNRAFILPASPDSTRRWLGVSLGAEDLVAILSGRVRPMRNPASVELVPEDLIGPSLKLSGEDGEQRIWFDPATGQPRQVEWTGRKNPARVTFEPPGADGAPTGLTLATLDGKLEAVARYREPRINTAFDPALLAVTIPEHVRVRDFR